MTGNRKAPDIAGQRFGRLVVVERVWNSKGQMTWLCRCDCGGTTVTVAGALKGARTRSCGCLFLEVLRGNVVTHGKAGTAEYRIWNAMRSRCRNKSNYEGRGITVCERWNDFSAFLADMGPRPGKRHSIDRIDNNGNYEPSNCRWATDFQQARNTRSNIFIEFNGERKCIAEWADYFGLRRGIFYKWNRRGIDLAAEFAKLEQRA